MLSDFKDIINIIFPLNRNELVSFLVKWFEGVFRPPPPVLTNPWWRVCVWTCVCCADAPSVKMKKDPVWVDIGDTADLMCEADANPIVFGMFSWEWMVTGFVFVLPFLHQQQPLLTSLSPLPLAPLSVSICGPLTLLLPLCLGGSWQRQWFSLAAGRPIFHRSNYTMLSAAPPS